MVTRPVPRYKSFVFDVRIQRIYKHFKTCWYNLRFALLLPYSVDFFNKKPHEKSRVLHPYMIKFKVKRGLIIYEFFQQFKNFETRKTRHSKGIGSSSLLIAFNNCRLRNQITSTGFCYSRKTS